MLLLLVRHALAAERDDQRYPDDALRPLVGKGRKVMSRMARRLRRLQIVPSVIWASPWKRAWQTAGILAVEAGVGKKQRHLCPPLADDPDLAAITAVIGTPAEDETIALVGHEPWLGELASLILTGSPTRLNLDFPKSAVMGIKAASLAPASGQLQFFLTPESFLTR